MYWIKKRSAVGLLAFIMALLLTVQAALATGAGEQSNSPGIPGQKPLSFMGITLADGGENVQNASDIPAGEPKFKLEFDKNVVNSTIWGINRNCFSLASQGGENVPVSVMKVDDSIDFAQRQLIFVQPAAPLSPGTTYTLKVSPDLKAKNGVSTLGGTTGGQGVAITFKTAGQAAPQSVTQQPAAQPAGQPAQTGGSQAQPAAGDSGQTPKNPGEPAGAGVQVQTGSQPAPGSTVDQENKPAGTGAGQQQVAVNQGANNTAGQPAASGQPETGRNTAGGTWSNLNYTTFLTVLAIILIAGWIAVEVFVKRRKER